MEVETCIVFDTLSFGQIYYVQTSTLWLVLGLRFQVKSYTPESISRESHVITCMMSSIDPIYQGASLM